MLQVFLISCDITHAIAHANTHTHTHTHIHLQKQVDVQTHTHTHTHRQVKPAEVCLHEIPHKLLKYCHLELCSSANAALL